MLHWVGYIRKAFVCVPMLMQTDIAHGAWHVHVRGWTFSFYPNSRSRRLALGRRRSDRRC
jgi:hypothetical protein